MKMNVYALKIEPASPTPERESRRAQSAHRQTPQIDGFEK
jgi:hypothetical protein